MPARPAQQTLISNPENTEPPQTSLHVWRRNPKDRMSERRIWRRAAQSRQHHPSKAERTEDACVIRRRTHISGCGACPCTWSSREGDHSAAETEPTWPKRTLCPYAGRVLVHFQLQPPSPGAPDHTICQTIPGGTFPSNSRSCLWTPERRLHWKIPPFFCLCVDEVIAMTGRFHCDGLWSTVWLLNFNQSLFTSKTISLRSSLVMLENKTRSSRCVCNNKLGLVTAPP